MVVPVGSPDALYIVTRQMGLLCDYSWSEMCPYVCHCVYEMIDFKAVLINHIVSNFRLTLGLLNTQN